MRRKHRRNVYIVLLLSAFLLSVLAGCGGDGSQNTNGNPTATDTSAISDAGNVETPPPEGSGDEVQHDSATSESSGDEGQHESASPEGDTVTVGSI